MIWFPALVLLLCFCCVVPIVIGILSLILFIICELSVVSGEYYSQLTIHHSPPHPKSFPQKLQVFNHRFQQWYSILHSFGFHFSLGIAGYQYFFFAFYGFCTPESFYPFIHMHFKFVSGTKCIYSHCTKEMSDAFSRLFIRHGNINRKWRNPWTIISTA